MSDSPDQTVDFHFDASGLMCPEPIMMLHGKVRDMKAGEVLEVIATDPATLRDIPKFCQFLGHELMTSDERDGKYYFKLRKSQ